MSHNKFGWFFYLVPERDLPFSAELLGTWIAEPSKDYMMNFPSFSRILNFWLGPPCLKYKIAFPFGSPPHKSKVMYGCKAAEMKYSVSGLKQCFSYRA